MRDRSDRWRWINYRYLHPTLELGQSWDYSLTDSRGMFDQRLFDRLRASVYGHARHAGKMFSIRKEQRGSETWAVITRRA